MKAREDKAVIQVSCSNSSKSTVILTYFWGGYQTWSVLSQKTFLPLIFPCLFTPFMLLSFMTFYDNLNMHQSKEVFYFKLLPVNESTWCSFSRKNNNNNYWQLISKQCFADSALTLTSLYPPVSFPLKLTTLICFSPLTQEQVQSLISADFLQLVFSCTTLLAGGQKSTQSICNYTT